MFACARAISSSVGGRRPNRFLILPMIFTTQDHTSLRCHSGTLAQQEWRSLCSMSGYDAVMRVAAREDAQFWLSVTRGFHTYVMSHGRQDGKAPDEVEFSFEHTRRAKVLRWLRRSPKEDAVARLTPLLDAGVIARVGEARTTGRPASSTCVTPMVLDERSTSCTSPGSE
jgi:hypothetical protein